MKKNHHTFALSRLFSGRIFLDTCRRLLFGTVIAAAALVLVCGIVGVEIASQQRSRTGVVVDNGEYSALLTDEEVKPAAVTDGKLDLPILLFSFTSPVFVFAAFSFARKKKEADWALALPATGTALFTGTFAAALALSWAVGLCGAAATWLPFLFFRRMFVPFSFIAKACGLYALNSAVLAGMAAVAVSLTGRLFAGVFTFAGMVGSAAAFFRGLSSIPGRVFTLCDTWHRSVLTPRWFLPFDLLGGLGNTYRWNPLHSYIPPDQLGTPNTVRVIVHIVFALAAAALACLFWNFRRSDAAESAASSQRHYRLIRGGLWVGLGLGTAWFLLDNLPWDLASIRLTRNDVWYIWGYLAVCALLMGVVVPVIFERGFRGFFRRSCRCWLLIGLLPLVAALGFGAVLGIQNYFQNETIPREQIAHVKYREDYGRSYGAKVLTEVAETADFSEDFLSQLAGAQEFSRAVYAGEKSPYTLNDLIEVTVTLTNGRVLHRMVLNDADTPENFRQMKLLRRSAEVRAAYLRLPDISEIRNASAEDRSSGITRLYWQYNTARVLSGVGPGTDPSEAEIEAERAKTQAEWESLWATFRAEYDLLTEDEKIALLCLNWPGVASKIGTYSVPPVEGAGTADKALPMSSPKDTPFCLQVYGNRTGDDSGGSFADTYYLPAARFPKTTAMIHRLIEAGE